MSNPVEVAKTLPVEEYYRDSPNDRLRNLALRILELRDEIKLRISVGRNKVGFFLPLGFTAAYIGFKSISEGNLEISVAAGLTLLGSGFLVESGIQDFTAASVARSEFSSLTTALAAEAIAGSKKLQLP